MPFANTSISDVIATTIQARNKKLADNFTNNNALLRQLKKKGNVRPFTGGNVILEELAYTDSTIINANSYSGLIIRPSFSLNQKGIVVYQHSIFSRYYKAGKEFVHFFAHSFHCTLLELCGLELEVQ